MKTALEAETSLDLVQQVSQSDGLHNQVFEVVDQMPARTVRDYENIVARLRALPAYVDQSIDLIREQLAAQRAQPAVVVNLMIDQVVAQASASPDASPLLAAFKSFPSEISAAEQNRLRTDARTAYSEQFVPSWKRLESFLRDTYLKQARPEIGIEHDYRWCARIREPDSRVHDDSYAGGRDPSARLEGGCPHRG